MYDSTLIQYMVVSMKKIIAILLITLFLLGGCWWEKKVTAKEYKKGLDKTYPKAVELCNKYGQQYQIHYTLDFEQYVVICITTNPYKEYVRVLP